MNEAVKEAALFPVRSNAGLDCETTAKPLRIEQLKNEPPGLFAMRAWAKAMQFMDTNEMRAAANWISARTQAELNMIHKQSNVELTGSALLRSPG